MIWESEIHYTKYGYKVIKIEIMNTLLFQLKEENYEIIPLLDKCRNYEYLSNRDGIFYLIVTGNSDVLASLTQVLTDDVNN